MGKEEKHHLQHGFPKTCQLTSMSNLLHVILQNHELLSLVTVSEAATIYWKVTLDSFVLLCAPPTPVICTEELQLTGDPTRGRWMPAREKRVKREDKHKKVFCHVSWRSWSYCVLRNARSRLPWQTFFLGFPFFLTCFPEEQLHRAPCLPQISPFSQRSPPSSYQNYRFLTLLLLHGGCQWDQTGEYSCGFSPSNLFKTFQRNKIPISLAAWEQQHSLQRTLLLVGLAKKGKPHRKIPNYHHLTFGVKKQEKIMCKFPIFKLWFLSSCPKISVFALWFKPLWKNSLREGPRAGIPGKYFTLFLLAPLPLQLSFHHWVHHPEHNQGLKHLKTGLSQPRKRAGFNVCRSTKALSPEHLTYWQAVWKGSVFLQVSSYFGSSEESISITIPHTDRAPCCFNSPRCCSCLSALYIKIITPINLNWARK